VACKGGQIVVDLGARSRVRWQGFVSKRWDIQVVRTVGEFYMNSLTVAGI